MSDDSDKGRRESHDVYKQMTNDTGKVMDRPEHVVQVANVSNDQYLYSNGGKLSSVKYRCWLHKTSNHTIEACEIFREMDHAEKLSAIRQVGACLNCLIIGHIAKNCLLPNKCHVLVAGYKCGKRHHSLLHKSNPTNYAAKQETTVHYARTEDNATLLAISSVRCNDQRVTVLWDSGADISLITHTAAARLHLTGDDVELSLVKVGNLATVLKSKRYRVPLVQGRAKSGPRAGCGPPSSGVRPAAWIGSQHCNPARETYGSPV